MLDRIDIHVEVTPVAFSELSSERKAESSEKIRERVINAIKIQSKRFENNPGTFSNAQMSANLLRSICKIDEAGQTLLKNAMEKLGLSARAYDRILKVARTIADLDSSDTIQNQHLAEAIQYRSLDRENRGG